MVIHDYFELSGLYQHPEHRKPMGYRIPVPRRLCRFYLGSFDEKEHQKLNFSI